MVRFLTATALLALGSGSALAQVSGDIVRIGVLNDRSGIYSDLSGEGSVIAARMAAEEMGNKAAGKPIEIIAADHQNKPDVGASVTRQWIDRDGVDVIADVPNSAVALAVQEISRDKKVPFLMSGPATTRLTGDMCSPVGFHWAYDTYALATGTGRAMVEEGGKSWYFITADYAFGHQLEKETSDTVKKMGGEVKGSVRHPIGTSDFASFLLQAQGSGAQVIGLANAGGDTINSIKQAASFGITQAGQQMAGLLLFISDIDALGLQDAQGLVLTTGFYWDLDDQTRAWSKKFQERTGKMPTMVQAGVYSAVRHYLKAVDTAGTDNGLKVSQQMHKLPVEDFFAKNGKLLPNGRLVHDMYLARVKTPAQSRERWDYYQIVRTIPGEQAYQSLQERLQDGSGRRAMTRS